MFSPDLGAEWDAQLTGTRWPYKNRTEFAPGFGLSVADFNDDGWLDVFLPMFGPNELYFGNKKGTLSNVTDQYLLESKAVEKIESKEVERSEGSVAADLDNDGDLDLLVLNRGINTLYYNDGLGHFTRGKDPFGGVYSEAMGAAIGDINRDGFLDIVTANRQEFVGGIVESGEPNELLFGSESGFLYAKDWLPKETNTGYTFLSSIVDIDADGWPDVYILNDFSTNIINSVPNIMLRNRGDKGPPFDDVSAATFTGLQVQSMGVGIGDINGDSLPDFVISNRGDPPLLESLEDGSWLQTEKFRALTTALPDPENGHYSTWGILLVDMDNDGDLDVPAVTGPVFAEDSDKNPFEQPDFLFLREDDSFVNVAQEWGVDHVGNHRGLVAVDMNQDGWLDLFRRDINGTTTVHYSRCGENNWLKVSLSQVSQNTSAIGAKVELFAGDSVQVRWVSTGSTGLSSSSPPVLHFGLGDLTDVAAVRITWPDGLESVFKGLVGNQTLHFSRE
jgi:hypothetical protein